MIPMTHRGWRRGVVVVSGVFFGGGGYREGSYREGKMQPKTL